LSNGLIKVLFRLSLVWATLVLDVHNNKFPINRMLDHAKFANDTWMVHDMTRTYVVRTQNACVILPLGHIMFTDHGNFGVLYTREM
jgi:hypothetical protein